eukprot:349687-Chlamydomonas_euryale.AAC.7
MYFLFTAPCYTVKKCSAETSAGLGLPLRAPALAKVAGGHARLADGHSHAYVPLFTRVAAL